MESPDIHRQIVFPTLEEDLPALVDVSDTAAAAATTKARQDCEQWQCALRSSRDPDCGLRYNTTHPSGAGYIACWGSKYAEGGCYSPPVVEAAYRQLSQKSSPEGDSHTEGELD